MSKKKSTAKANFQKTPRKDALVVAAKLSQALWPLSDRDWETNDRLRP